MWVLTGYVSFALSFNAVLSGKAGGFHGREKTKVGEGVGVVGRPKRQQKQA